MSDRGLRRFLDALTAGRRPKRFRATPEEAALARTAITLRAARPGDDVASDSFVESLFAQMSEQAKPEPAPVVRPQPVRRSRIAIATVAAAAALVTATAVTTEALTGSSGASFASGVPRGSQLRTGTFQAAGGEVLGQIFAFRGDHSFVFMNVGLPHFEGRVTCMLQIGDGTTVAFGTFNVHNGTGQFSKAIDGVNVAQLRGAKLVTDSGSPVASATFAA